MSENIVCPWCDHTTDLSTERSFVTIAACDSCGRIFICIFDELVDTIRPHVVLGALRSTMEPEIFDMLASGMKKYLASRMDGQSGESTEEGAKG